jgi:hypothetical protein
LLVSIGQLAECLSTDLGHIVLVMPDAMPCPEYKRLRRDYEAALRHWGDVPSLFGIVFPDCSVSGVGSNRPGDRIDEDVDRFGEGRPTLDMVIAD